MTSADLYVAGRDLVRPELVHETLYGGIDFDEWYAATGRDNWTSVTVCSLDELDRWASDRRTGDIVHDTGRFFRVTGLEVHRGSGPVQWWQQPIIDQPEIGILGLLAKTFDGRRHLLVQGKCEPGNVNGVQLSPTVQATRSNYTQAHGGRRVPYLDHFRNVEPTRVVSDVLQSEQGAWFFRKRNRNMIVETDDDVEVLPGFAWIAVDQLHRLLSRTDLLNMDTRTVLSCLPFVAAGCGTDSTPDSVARSSGLDSSSQSSWSAVLSWINEHRCREDRRSEPTPLGAVTQGPWRRTAECIEHDSGKYFSIRGVSVESSGREVGRWSQPILAPRGEGVAAFLLADFDGVAHVLVRASSSPGYCESIELGPTVQCSPANYGPGDVPPMFLADVMNGHTAERRFDTVLSEEGGRFFHARTRYIIQNVDPDSYRDIPVAFRWMTLAQLETLLQHSNYVNVEARTLVVGLRSVLRRAAG